MPNINADAEVTCTVEGYPLNNVRWYFNQIDFNIETEIKNDQFHKVDNIVTPDSIKSMLVIRNVNPEHFGNYKIRVEGGQQEVVERIVGLEEMMPDADFNNSNHMKMSCILWSAYKFISVFTIFCFERYSLLM